MMGWHKLMLEVVKLTCAAYLHSYSIHIMYILMELCNYRAFLCWRNAEYSLHIIIIRHINIHIFSNSIRPHMQRILLTSAVSRIVENVNEFIRKPCERVGLMKK